MFQEIGEELMKLPDLQRKRKHPSSRKENSVIALKNDTSIESLPDILHPLTVHVFNIGKVRSAVQEGIGIRKYLTTDGMPEQSDYEKYFEVGTKLTVKWTAEEIGDSGWRPGWYVADVQSSSIETDKVDIVYRSEPEVVYTIEVTPLLAEGKLR